MVKIVINMEGGIIQGIVSNEPVEIYVIDYDTDGIESDHPHLTSFGGDECLLYRDESDINADVVGLVEKTWKVT